MCKKKKTKIRIFYTLSDTKVSNEPWYRLTEWVVYVYCLLYFGVIVAESWMLRVRVEKRKKTWRTSSKHWKSRIKHTEKQKWNEKNRCDGAMFAFTHNKQFTPKVTYLALSISNIFFLFFCYFYSILHKILQCFIDCRQEQVERCEKICECRQNVIFRNFQKHSVYLDLQSFEKRKNKIKESTKSQVFIYHRFYLLLLYFAYYLLFDFVVVNFRFPYVYDNVLSFDCRFLLSFAVFHCFILPFIFVLLVNRAKNICFSSFGFWLFDNVVRWRYLLFFHTSSSFFFLGRFYTERQVRSEQSKIK